MKERNPRTRIYGQDANGNWWTCKWGTYNRESQVEGIEETSDAVRVTPSERVMRVIATLNLAFPEKDNDNSDVEGVGFVFWYVTNKQLVYGVYGRKK